MRVFGLAEVDVLPAKSFVPKDAPQQASRSLVGDVTIVRALGLSMLNSEDVSMISFGYARQTSAFVRNCYDPIDLDTTLELDCKDSHLSSDELLDQNPRHYFGFVDLRLQQPADDAQVAGSYASQQIVGVSLLGFGEEQALSLGYYDGSLVALKPDVLVVENPIHAVPKEIRTSASPKSEKTE